MIIERYLKLASLQENENGFKGATTENRNFECLISNSNVIFLVSNLEILRILLDKLPTNWIDYKELASNKGLTLDDSEVTIQFLPKKEVVQEVVKVEEVAPKPQPKPKEEVKPAAKPSNAKKPQGKSSNKKANTATKK